MYIYVQAQDGTPLMPTQRAGKVRRMLRDGRAVIATHTPFTIRLTYKTTHHTQPVSLGVDAGSKHIGLSDTTEHKELYAAEIELRSDIVGNLSDRREAKHVEVVIINKGEENVRFEEELAKDVLEIITVFSARLYGSRSNKNKKLLEDVQKAVEDNVKP